MRNTGTFSLACATAVATFFIITAVVASPSDFLDKPTGTNPVSTSAIPPRAATKDKPEFRYGGPDQVYNYDYSSDGMADPKDYKTATSVPRKTEAPAVKTDHNNKTATFTSIGTNSNKTVSNKNKNLVTLLAGIVAVVIRNACYSF